AQLADRLAAAVRSADAKRLEMDAVAALRVHESTQRQRAAALHVVLDALPANVAVLDEVGQIVLVNGAWRDFAVANGYAGRDFGVGVNYIELCARTDDPTVRESGRGIGDVL